MTTVSKTYNTRQKRKSVEPVRKSRVDWKRTKRDDLSHFVDSDESITSEEEELEETDEGSDNSDCSEESEDQKDEDSLPEEDGEGRIRRSRLKSKSAMIDSESSSDSDGPGQKVIVKRSCVIKEDDSDEAAVDEETKVHIKKKKRLEALKQLAKRQRSRKRTVSHESAEESPHDEYEPLIPETQEESQDSDNMSDFIVPDEESNDGSSVNPTSNVKKLFKKHHISLSASHDLSSHLEKVIKAFLMDIAEEKSLRRLYNGKRKKRRWKDQLNSLNYLDERILAPRLEKLTTSCRWTNRYKERINCYPRLQIKHIAAELTACEACHLQRYCSYLVTLSGKAYDHKTLEADDFLQDDTQKLVIGKTCANRTEAYHLLRHYKYFLYQRCIPFIEEAKEESADEIVESALSKMEDKGFLGREMTFLEGYLNEADYFHEEEKDSLLS
ncbi:coiled-coil domain-containing protein 82-like [Leptodactylus fuscus]|uniref:coiled-coil domain-containing protein 82-like n=1 Tax=Leptodactylus fuscus TaxID=238119 RepID=UPI003F4E8B87